MKFCRIKHRKNSFDFIVSALQRIIGSVLFVLIDTTNTNANRHDIAAGEWQCDWVLVCFKKTSLSVEKHKTKTTLWRKFLLTEMHWIDKKQRKREKNERTEERKWQRTKRKAEKKKSFFGEFY